MIEKSEVCAMNHALFTRSIAVILENQSPWGSFVASPAFPTYHYSWLRDGTYIAYAMDCVGQHESAAAFYRWLGSTVMRYAEKVDEMERRVRLGKPFTPDLFLHTRFTLDGLEAAEQGWGNFQVDGYGTWLWGLAQHSRMAGSFEILRELAEAVDTTARYLAMTWKLPNYDCWEEHSEYTHPYTLACVYGGLNEVAMLEREGRLRPLSVDAAELALEVRDFILKYGVVNGGLVKHIAPPNGDAQAYPIAESGVDASLLGLTFPYQVVDVEDPVMAATAQQIEAELHRKGGGVYRYARDVYYGGGEWILLAAWLGVHNLLLGRENEAARLLEWIESQADEAGNLPEQVNDHALYPEHYQPWLEKWGPVASPLLWSHASYLILYSLLKAKQDQ